MNNDKGIRGAIQDEMLKLASTSYQPGKISRFLEETLTTAGNTPILTGQNAVRALAEFNRKWKKSVLKFDGQIIELTPEEQVLMVTCDSIDEYRVLLNKLQQENAMVLPNLLYLDCAIAVDDSEIYQIYLPDTNDTRDEVLMGVVALLQTVGVPVIIFASDSTLHKYYNFLLDLRERAMCRGTRTDHLMDYSEFSLLHRY